MSEIEKLYKNAGIKKHITCDHANCPQYGAFGRDKCAVKTRIPTEECIKNKEYTTAEYVYPSFTAEKQLELLKLFGIKYANSDITTNSKEADIWSLYFNIFRKTKEGFDEALAGLFNFIWKDLTPEEKAEIKEILNEY